MWNREGGYDGGYRRHGTRGYAADFGSGMQRYGREFDSGMRRYGGDFAGGNSGYPGRGYDSPRGPAPERGHGRDYWWLGEHELRRRGRIGGYDAGYQRFDEQTHPRYSPVGGMYPAMGGGYYSRHSPRPLRENMWFSDWTRWF